MSHFNDYKDKYENLKLERTDSGILTVTMHTNGSSHIHTGNAHREFAEAFAEIARDRQSCRVRSPRQLYNYSINQFLGTHQNYGL